jgi:DNA modification methylase
MKQEVEIGGELVNAAPVSRGACVTLGEIERLDAEAADRFRGRVNVQQSLTRSLVSFQANKTLAAYRWYKYKEAFSAPLIEHLLARYAPDAKRILDPFAGSGTTLFVASAAGVGGEGIELLPIGQEIIEARKLLEEFTPDEVAVLRKWSTECPWTKTEERRELPELRITRGAYPAETRDAIERFMAALENEGERMRRVLRFALLCVLESVSYTRKDGQYLRWDYRSGRRQGQRPFDKGPIAEFARAVSAKLEEIAHDVETIERPAGLFPASRLNAGVGLRAGSCLSVMPALETAAYDAVITSPPYCNRYDYTRTYALELALLGVGEQELINLRQEMLSCTVENRAKDLLTMNPRWEAAVAAADAQGLLQTVLRYLEEQKAEGNLNNNGIPRMVRGYFYEMACAIAECGRVLKRGAPVVMVNDNVRYVGASISVDIILSDIAERLGFTVENILVLPGGKGNSSQQMGEHGREPLRKCIYVWRKT